MHSGRRGAREGEFGNEGLGLQSLRRTVMAVPVLLNRHGGALAADPGLADRAREALSSAGIDFEVELLSGGDFVVRCKAVAERGDPW